MCGVPKLPRKRYPESMHEDDTLSRFEHSEPFTGRIEPLDGYVLVEPVDDETETNAGLIIPASTESACIAGIVVAAGDDASGVAPGDKGRSTRAAPGLRSASAGSQSGCSTGKS